MLVLLQAVVLLLIFAVGVTATSDDVGYLGRRRSLLLRSVVAMYVVVPLAAIALGHLLPVPRSTRLALVILAICAGAPLLPRRLLQFGNAAFVFSLVVITSLLAIVTVPASLFGLSWALAFENPAVEPGRVAALLLRTFLLPLAAGVLVRRAMPELAARLGPALLRLANAALWLCVLFVLVARFGAVLDVGAPSLLAFALFTAAALGAGHALGGPVPADRASLAVACASRHIGLALLIAAHAPRERALALVLAYLLASLVVSTPYLAWMARRAAAGGEAGR